MIRLLPLLLFIALFAPAVAEDTKEAAKKKVPVKRPETAVKFNGHYYQIVPQRVSWHAGKKACEAVGGYLACIETQEEQEFLAKLCDGKYYFLGASDENKEGTWVWINGAKFDYQSWYSGQPNNYGDEEHYLATYDEGDWVDVAVEGEEFWMPIGYICEWEE